MNKLKLLMQVVYGMFTSGKLLSMLEGLVEALGFLDDVQKYLQPALHAVATNGVSYKKTLASIKEKDNVLALVWPHGEKEIDDTCDGFTALIDLITLADTALTSGTEADWKKVSDKVADPALKQLIPSL